MAVRTLTYRDLTQKQRAHGARKAREKLLGLLQNPFLTGEQRQAVFTKIGNLDQWEHLKLDDTYAPPSFAPRALETPAKPAQLPARTPQHHDVGLDETVPSGDKVS